jgi:hypothetical protein
LVHGLRKSDRGNMLQDEDDEKSQPVMQTMLHMDKIDIQGLQEAYMRQ